MLHLERNAISKLEPTGLLSSVTPKLRELYLTNNTITAVAKGALDSAFLGTLHLDSNQLTEIPTQALSEASNLEELSLSQNTIRWVGPNAFKPISQSLKRLYMDHMGVEKVPYVLSVPCIIKFILLSFFQSIMLADQLFKLYHHPDVQGCSGGVGSRAEGSDSERKPAGGAS